MIKTGFMGHTHGNRPYNPDYIYLLGGFGMGGLANFGIPVLDTTGGRVRLLYFPLRNIDGLVSSYSSLLILIGWLGRWDQYEEVMDCVSKNGIGGCEYMAEIWMNQPLDSLQ